MTKKTRDEIAKEIIQHGKDMGFPSFPKKKPKPNDKK